MGKTEWIPCSERLPEAIFRYSEDKYGYDHYESDMVYVTTADGEVIEASYVSDKITNPKVYEEECGGTCKPAWLWEEGTAINVIAWMPIQPLPEPYKGERGEDDGRRETDDLDDPKIPG